MILIYLLILGLCIGSFLNVLIDRLPNDESIMGRSHCDYCKKTLEWYDLIPIISFFYQKGRCRYCHKKLSWQYPLVEVLTGSVFSILYSIFSIKTNNISFFVFHFSLYAILSSCFIVIFFSDLKYRIIPDQILIILFFAVLMNNILTGLVLFNLITGLVCFFIFLAIYLLTKEKGIGFGDVKLSFIIGWFLGIPLALASIYFSFILGGIFSLFLLFSKKAKLKTKIAFGPFMILGIVIVLLLKKQTLDFIFNLFI